MTSGILSPTATVMFEADENGRFESVVFMLARSGIGDQISTTTGLVIGCRHFLHRT